MAVRKICRQKGCRASPRCEHPWWFDVMHEGKRWRMLVDEFAIARGATEPITVKQTAEQVWEPKFLGEIIAGRDPRIPPGKPRADGRAHGVDVPRPVPTRTTSRRKDSKSADTISGHHQSAEGVARRVAGHGSGEAGGDCCGSRRNTGRGHEVATVNRALGVLRAAINWGRFQDPPYSRRRRSIVSASRIKAKDETKRDRRIHRDEEQALLAACSTDELGRAQVRGTRDARPHHRRARNLLPARRDAAHPEPATWTGTQHQIVDSAASTRRTRRTGAFRSIRTGDSLRSSSDARRWDRTRSCSAHRRESSRIASRRPGNRSCWSRTATKRNAPSPGLGSIARSCGKSTCTGTTSVTRAPAGSWRRRRHPHDPIDARALRHQDDAALPEHH